MLAQPVSETVSLCNKQYTVRGDVSGDTYSIIVVLDGNTVRTIKIKKKKKEPRNDFKKALSDSLHQNNLFGAACQTDYGLIYSFATRFTEKAMQIWFPEAGFGDPVTIRVNENISFQLDQGQFDKKFQLIFSKTPGTTVPLVSYDYKNYKYVIDWTQINNNNTAEIKKNIDKFLNCYNALTSSVKPTLYFAQTSETEYSIAEADDDDESATTKVTNIPKKIIASLLGDPKGIKVDNVYRTVYTMNFTPMPAPASKKANNAQKFKEHN